MQGNAFASRITGTGSAFPSRRLTNEELCRTIDSTPEWILERTGIQERRVSDPSNPEEQNSSLALKASRLALEMAGKTPDQIDAIVYATCTPDTILPSAGCWLQGKLGAKHAWAVDMNAACSGFVFALATADQYIRSGMCKTVLVVGSDLMSTITNWTDRGSCILFADGAGAMVIEQTSLDSPSRILSSHLWSDGGLWDLFLIPAGGSNLEVTPERHEQHLHKMQMKGREIFKHAVKTMADYAITALETHGLKLEDLHWVVAHQANLRIIEGVAKRLDLPMERMIVNIDRFGNTSAGTIPTALDEAVRAGKIQRGQHVLLDAFGAGVTSGSILIRW